MGGSFGVVVVGIKGSSSRMLSARGRRPMRPVRIRSM